MELTTEDSIVICLVALSFLLLSLWWKLSRTKSEQSKTIRSIKRNSTIDTSSRDKKYGRLLAQLLGDKNKASRLIEHAKAKNPRLTEEQCIEFASQSLEGDIKRWD